MKEALYKYFKGLETGNVSMIFEVFAMNAMVYSPLYGHTQAVQFYSKLFADTNRSDINILNIFESTQNNYSASVHFKYHWKLKDGTPTHFECVDIFAFDENDKITELTIIYDTAHLRTSFEALSNM